MMRSGRTIASSTNCVPRSERASRRPKSDALSNFACKGLRCLAFTSGLPSVSLLVEHGLCELRVDGAATRLKAALAEHDSLAYVLGLHVAARAALNLRL